MHAGMTDTELQIGTVRTLRKLLRYIESFSKSTAIAETPRRKVRACLAGAQVLCALSSLGKINTEELEGKALDNMKAPHHITQSMSATHPRLSTVRIARLF